MNDKVPIVQLDTGVPGLNDVLGGGLPEFSFNLLAGGPGAGKTTLVHQICFALATPDRPALYITVLGEPPLKLLRYQQQFSFFDETKINQQSSLRFGHPRCPGSRSRKGLRADRGRSGGDPSQTCGD